MRILSTVLGLAAVLFSVSAWHWMADASFWNLSHSVTFTLLPMVGLYLLYKAAEDALEEH